MQTRATGSRVAILAGARTPFAKALTALKGRSALDLAVHSVEGLLEKQELDPASVGSRTSTPISTAERRSSSDHGQVYESRTWREILSSRRDHPVAVGSGSVDSPPAGDRMEDRLLSCKVLIPWGWDGTGFPSLAFAITGQYALKLPGRRASGGGHAAS